MNRRTPVYPYLPDLDEHAACADALWRALMQNPAIEDSPGLEYAPGQRIKRVFREWAEPEDVAEYPSACILPPDEGSFDPSSLTPQPLAESWRSDCPQPNLLYQVAEFVGDFRILLWATDPIMRSRLVLAVCTAFQDLTDESKGYGINLPCPRYFGGFSDMYASLRPAMRFPDGEDSAAGRTRLAYLTIGCRIPVLRLAGAAPMRPEFRLDASTDPDVVG